MKLDPKAAAEKIHEAVNHSTGISTEDRHTAAYVSEVVAHLGLDDTPEHHNIVLAELVKAGIEPHNAQEYPAWVELHASHVSKDAYGVLTLPEWVHESHVARDGTVTVLVHDEDESDVATAAAGKK